MAAKSDNKRSDVWMHFKEIGDNRAKCGFCSSVLSFKGGSVYNLARHLKTRHVGVLNKKNNTNTQNKIETSEQTFAAEINENNKQTVLSKKRNAEDELEKPKKKVQSKNICLKQLP